MDICLITLLLMIAFIVLVEFKKETFTGTVEYKNNYFKVASSNNTENLLKNKQKCKNYCSTVPKSTHCSISCDNISTYMTDNIKLQQLIFGRDPPDDVSLNNLKKVNFCKIFDEDLNQYSQYSQ